MSHWVHPRFAVMAAVCGILFVACGHADVGAGSTQMAPSDPRAVAIQKALDARPPHAIVIGNVGYCDSRTIAIYKRLPQVHVTPASDRLGRKCEKIIWDADTGVASAPAFDSYQKLVAIGRFIVDKVGEAEQRPSFGTTVTVTPFRAHFEASGLGESLLKEHLATTPADLTDGLAVMHKDADGQWIAQV